MESCCFFLVFVFFWLDLTASAECDDLVKMLRCDAMQCDEPASQPIRVLELSRVVVRFCSVRVGLGWVGLGYNKLVVLFGSWQPLAGPVECGGGGCRDTHAVV